MIKFTPLSTNDPRSINLAFDEVLRQIKTMDSNVQKISKEVPEVIKQTLIDYNLVSATATPSPDVLLLEGSALTDLSVVTPKIDEFAVTRGAQFYSAGTINFNTTTEVEIGTITLYTNEVTDSVWIWSNLVILQIPLSTVKGGGGPTGFSIKIRRDVITTGALIYSANVGVNYCKATIGVLVDFVPIVIMGTDVPGGSVGAHTYKLSIVTDAYADYQVGQVAYRQMMGMAKSR
jgi:hypothetical protein